MISSLSRGSPGRVSLGRGAGAAVALGAVIGLLLLALNVFGLFQPLRSPLLRDGYRDFSSDRLMSYSEAVDRLDALDPTDRQAFAMEANRIFSQAMAHVGWDFLEFDDPLFDDYHYTVPVWENYILYALRFLKPDTYRSYEFCSYERALERGVGQCGQQSMALIGFLQEQGFDTAFVYLDGHVVATAEVAPGRWVTLDPDFGVSIPYPVQRLETDRALVETYYRDHLDRNPWPLYGSRPNRIVPGGPEARYARACPIERAAYLAKWLFPALLILPSGLWAASRARGRRSA